MIEMAAQDGVGERFIGEPLRLEGVNDVHRAARDAAGSAYQPKLTELQQAAHPLCCGTAASIAIVPAQALFLPVNSDGRIMPSELAQ
jgi:hypothetical protein